MADSKGSGCGFGLVCSPVDCHLHQVALPGATHLDLLLQFYEGCTRPDLSLSCNRCLQPSPLALRQLINCPDPAPSDVKELVAGLVKDEMVRIIPRKLTQSLYTCTDKPVPTHLTAGSRAKCVMDMAALHADAVPLGMQQPMHIVHIGAYLPA